MKEREKIGENPLARAPSSVLAQNILTPGRVHFLFLLLLPLLKCPLASRQFKVQTALFFRLLRGPFRAVKEGKSHFLSESWRRIAY